MTMPNMLRLTSALASDQLGQVDGRHPACGAYPGNHRDCPQRQPGNRRDRDVNLRHGRGRLAGPAGFSQPSVHWGNIDSAGFALARYALRNDDFCRRAEIKNRVYAAQPLKILGIIGLTPR